MGERAVRTPIRQLAIEEMTAAGCDLDELLAVESAWMITWDEGRGEITAYATEDDEIGTVHTVKMGARRSRGPVRSVWDGVVAGAIEAADAGGWRLDFNPDGKRVVLVSVGGTSPKGLAARRLCWLALGGGYEMSTMVGDSAWLPTVWLGCAVETAPGDGVAVSHVVDNLLRTLVEHVEGCARAAGYPDGRMPDDSRVVLSGGVHHHAEPVSLWVYRHTYAVGVGVVAAVA